MTHLLRNPPRPQSPMADLGVFNTPPPAQVMPPSLDDFNAQPAPAMPLPPVPPSAPPAPAAPRAMPAGPQMGADQLNALSLALAQGQQMPTGADPAMWARLSGVYGR
jgi:hypothetical protein